MADQKPLKRAATPGTVFSFSFSFNHDRPTFSNANHRSMIGEHDKDTNRRSLAFKLPGFLTRHSSTKTKASEASSSSPASSSTPVEKEKEKASLFRFRQRKSAHQGRAPVFKPLEVETGALAALELPDGWLEAKSRRGSQPKLQSQLVLPVTDATPIAHQFANKSALNLLGGLGTLAPEEIAARHDVEKATRRRPVSMVETSSASHSRAALPSADPIAEHDGESTILSRGRPVEPRPYMQDVPRVTKSLRQELAMAGLSAGHEAMASRNSFIADTIRVVHEPAQDLDSVLMPPPPPPMPRSVSPLKRTSTNDGVSTPFNAPATPSRSLTAPRSLSAAPADRIQTWQKQITSNPKLRPVPAPEAAPGVVRPSPSTRKLNTDRLAWIRELEGKRATPVNRHLPPKQAGSVSDKLAMFESKQLRTTSTPSRLPPLSRSNSTSRHSVAGLESVFSADSMTAPSSRTSIDTVRSTKRASSVMSHYDDAFREKMESIAGANVADKAEEAQ